MHTKYFYPPVAVPAILPLLALHLFPAVWLSEQVSGPGVVLG